MCVPTNAIRAIRNFVVLRGRASPFRSARSSWDTCLCLWRQALGSNNWSIRKLFLYNASYLILLGLFWGNLLGLGLLFAQKYFKLFPLDPSVYYVSEAPVYISLSYIVALNIGTLILCLLMLLIPSYIITKISPVKAIRFQ